MGGVGAHLDHLGVAGKFTLRHETVAQPPDGRVEPINEAGHLGSQIGPKIASGDMAQFVEEHHAQGLLIPEHAVGGQVNHGAEEAGNGGRNGVGVEASAHLVAEAELVTAVFEDPVCFRIVGIERLATPAIQGREISEQAQGKREEATDPGDREPRDGGGDRAGIGAAGQNGNFHHELRKERQEGEGKKSEQSAQGEERRTGGILPTSQPDRDHGEEGKGCAAKK